MDKQSSNKTSTILLFTIVFLLPNLFFYHISSRDRDVYFERVDENQEKCLQRAKEDSVETRWCNEIKSSSELVFNAADKSFEIGLLMNLFLPVVYSLIITTKNLGKQVEELTEKLNV